MLRGALAAVTGGLVACASAFADDPIWSFEGALGNAYSLETPLMISQDEAPELKFRARWRTRGFDSPIYYSWRIARWEGSRAWAVELIHHKLSLDRPPAEIEHFEVTHGYNLVTLNRQVKHRRWLAGAGLGVVVAHPESRVRGLALDSRRGLFEWGYHLTGPAVSMHAGVRQPIAFGWSAGVEGRFTAAYARLPVEQGWSSVPNVAVHLLAGLAYAVGPRGAPLR